MAGATDQKLFPVNLQEGEWVEFRAQGYKHPASGIVFGSGNPPTNGMPIGGIDTGCIDVGADGTLGYCTLFNSHVPRRGPLNLPFLGIAVDKRVVMLSTMNLNSVSVNQAGAGELHRVTTAKEMHYWGH